MGNIIIGVRILEGNLLSSQTAGEITIVNKNTFFKKYDVLSPSALVWLGTLTRSLAGAALRQ